VSIVRRYIERPHLLISLVLLAAVIGLVGYSQMRYTLFPDVERPQMAVVTVVPGASAADVEADVSRVIEKELSAIEGLRRVVSVNKDEVSTVTAEFEYGKSLDAAATDVANGVQKIRALLPESALPSMLFRIWSNTQPVLTLALRPKPGSPLDLAMVRQLADSPIKERLLQIPEVENAEVFGAHQPVVRVELDRDRLERYQLTPLDVRQALVAHNANQPLGLVIGRESQYLLTRSGQFQGLGEIGEIPVARRPGGAVHLQDVASVAWGVQEPQSAYHGDGQPAIGINVQRAPSGNILATIASVARVLPELQRTYPGIEFTIPDSQQEVIDRAISNMLRALAEAVLLTVLVIFAFLADWRGMTLAAISIPFTYLLTFGAMWLMGMEFNIVTLTAVVVAVGMLLDDAVVVIENIERHYHEVGRDVRLSAVGGTEEVLLAIFSGTYATVMVLVPIIFVGGFVQQIMRPLATTLSLALVASYVVSVTVIPLLAPFVLRRAQDRGRGFFERWVFRFDAAVVEPLRAFFVRLTAVGLRHRGLVLATALALFLLSTAQMPVLGRNVLPPMDTGILRVAFEVDANTSLRGAEETLSRMEQIVRARPEVSSLSSTIGSEPAAISFGGGRTAQQGVITVHLLDRFHRRATVWQIEADLRSEFRKLQGLKSVDVSEAGATPLTTIRAPVDVMITGPDRAVLDRLACEVERRLRARVRGLVSVSRTWTLDGIETGFVADPEKLALHALSPVALTGQLAGAVRGTPSSLFRVPNQDGLPLWVQMSGSDRTATELLEDFPVVTPRGPVPLSEFGRFVSRRVAAATTRQGLSPSVDVLGFRAQRSIIHLQQDVEAALRGLDLPPGYTVSHEGDIRLMEEAFGRLARALALGLVLLYFSLVPAFRSWLHPLTIMSAIPLGVIGAVWSMLVVGKQMCVPAFMGLILLGGIVVKNSILLIDFIAAARARGEGTEGALTGSVQIRTRPILMTAVATAVAMVPIAMERAIGLERISPLAVVSIGGLMVSTFLTMVFVPVLYSLFEDASRWVRARVIERPGDPHE
jgi:multidrug efflux pump subunit AcrB